MTLPISIDANDPQRVAAALARIWGSESYPVPGGRAWMVFAEDDAAVEVRRRAPASGRASGALALVTPWSEAKVHEIAAAEGWPSVTQSRGGILRAIEVWVEDRVMVEVLTDEMQAEHQAATTWRPELPHAA